MDFLPKEVLSSTKFDISHKTDVIKSGNKFFLSFLQNHLNYVIPACFSLKRFSLKDSIKEVKINSPIKPLIGIRFCLIDKEPYLEIPAFYYLKDYIKYQRKKIVCLPVHYSSKGIEGKHNHVAVLFIDTFYKKAYLVDPNTKSMYYNTIFDKPLELVEKTILFVCENLELKYQKQETWVTWKESTNRRLKIDHSLFEVGNCYLLSFIFIMMMHKKVHIENLHKIIGSLSNEEYIFLVSKVATYLYTIKPVTTRRAWEVFDKS